MADSLNKKLLKRLENVKIALKVGGDTNPYFDNREKLISLLMDHPHFLKQVEIWRRDFKLPPATLTDERRAFLWEQSTKKKVQELRSAVASFVGDFSFNAVYRGDIEQFTYDLTICPIRTAKIGLDGKPVRSKKQIPTLITFEADEDKNVNAHLVSPQGKYVQIFEWTTLRDIQENWKDIKVDSDRKSLDVETGSELSRLVWRLRRDRALKNKEIAQEVNRSHKRLLRGLESNLIGEIDVAVYLHNYEKRLKRLRKY